MPLLQIANKSQAADFANRWRYKGLAIPLDDAHKQFAVDFANVVITSFLEAQQRAAQQRAAAQVAKESVKIVEE